MMMPVMNGWEFSEVFMKKFDHLCPIIVMTAAVDAAQRAQEIRAVGWIEKPFILENLVLLIEKHARKN